MREPGYTAQHTETTTESTIAVADGVRQHVIVVREAVSAKLDELVAYEDDLTIHRIALQALASRPDAIDLTLVSDDELSFIVRVSEIVGLDEDKDPRYQGSSTRPTRTCSFTPPWPTAPVVS